MKERKEITLKDVSKNIVELMDKNKITQTELSKKTGLTQPNISNITNFKIDDVKFSTLKRIAEGLGASIGDIIKN